MQHKVIYFLAFVLALLSGLGLTKLYHRWVVTFEVVGGGSGAMCDVGLLGFTSMRTADGERASFSRIRFPSEQAAAECFEDTLEGSAHATDFGPLYDEAGENIVGRRVITRENDGEGYATILSLDGDRIYAVDSTSLRHALIFEANSRKY